MRNRPPTGRRRLALALSALLGGSALIALPTTAGAADGGGVAVQYRTSASGATADQSEPWLKVRNTGSTSVQLSQVKIRYYFKADSASTSYRFACSWAVKGCANITGTFGTPANPTATADRYLEIGFTSSAGMLASGANTGDMQLRFYQSNWQTLNQADDYSFSGAQTSYADWNKVTAQLAGATVWGTAPAGNDPTDPTDPTDPPGGGQSLFDDFSYTSYTDPAISAHGWNVRSNSGGPGVPGANWDPRRSPSPPCPATR